MTIAKAYNRLRQLNYLIEAAQYDRLLNPNPDMKRLRELKEEERKLTKLVTEFAEDPMTQYCGL